MAREYTEQELKMMIPEREFRFEMSRSSGAGGQNVNRRETKVQIWWDVNASSVFDEEERGRVRKYFAKFPSHITEDGIITFWSQQERTQERNRELALQHFFEHLARALRPEKVRKEVSMEANPASLRQEKEYKSRKKRDRKKVRFEGE